MNSFRKKKYKKKKKKTRKIPDENIEIQTVEEVLGEAAPSGGSSGLMVWGGYLYLHYRGEIFLQFNPVEHHPLLGRRASPCTWWMLENVAGICN